MSIMNALLKVAAGAADTALEYQTRSPKYRRKQQKQQAQAESECTPCAAAAYVDELRKAVRG